MHFFFSSYVCHNCDIEEDQKKIPQHMLVQGKYKKIFFNKKAIKLLRLTKSADCMPTVRYLSCLKHSYPNSNLI